MNQILFAATIAAWISAVTMFVYYHRQATNVKCLTKMATRTGANSLGFNREFEPSWREANRGGKF